MAAHTRVVGSVLVIAAAFAVPPAPLAGLPAGEGASVAFAASRPPVRAKNGMVASSSPVASRVGVEILKKGGNAIDAAVAVGFALAVTWPTGGNIGGGGFLLLRKAGGDAEIIDYRETAPAAATRDMYLDAKGEVVPNLSTRSYRAAGVPGTVAGLALAHERHGKLKWADVVAPARKLAAEGFALDHGYVKELVRYEETLARYPESKRVYLGNGTLPREGDRFRQPDLGRTLRRIETKGPREFYEGETARLIVADMKANEGLITAEDLRSYGAAIRKPITGTYRGHEILTMPPPSSGGAVLLQMLNVLEGDDLASLGHNSSAHLHLVIEAMRRAFADRSELLGDTDFVKSPVAGLVSKTYAATVRKSIDAAKATPSARWKPGDPSPYESPQTTHFSVVDAQGNAVSNTYTINAAFGNGATVKGAGFLLNNEMDDFTSKPGVPNRYGLVQNERNAIAPRKRPLSSMTPTIVVKGGAPLLVVGSPGGPTIINSVFQTISNVIDFGMNVQEAVDAPRIHHQWIPDTIRHEPGGINADTRKALEARGHAFSDKPGNMGDVQAIFVSPANGMRLGAADSRNEGAATGY